MREIRHKSPVPLYGAAAVSALYALLLPMYRVSHYCFFAAAIIIAFAALSKIFPGSVEHIMEPVSTGDADIDALLREGELAVTELARLRDSESCRDIKAKISAIMDVTDRIFKDVLEDPDDYRQIRRFADFYLPTTMKLLNAYDRFGKHGSVGDGELAALLGRIESALDQIIDSYNRQFDALFRNQSLDIETDIEVLEQMLKKEGLTERDFAI